MTPNEKAEIRAIRDSQGRGGWWSDSRSTHFLWGFALGGGLCVWLGFLVGGCVR